MWIFTTEGFLSIVQHKSKMGYFQVRSRTIEPLKIYWPNLQVEVIDWADYRYRITMRKEDAMPVLIDLILSIEYTNFKNACDDYQYRVLLGNIWRLLFEYQSRIESNLFKNNKVSIGEFDDE